MTKAKTSRPPLRLADLMEAPAALQRFIPTWETLFLNLHRTSPETLVSIAAAVGWALEYVRERSAFGTTSFGSGSG